MYTCNLPGGERLNLAQIRSLQFEEPPIVVMVVWTNGDRSIYRGSDALDLLMAWDKFSPPDELD